MIVSDQRRIFSFAPPLTPSSGTEGIAIAEEPLGTEVDELSTGIDREHRNDWKYGDVRSRIDDHDHAAASNR